MAATHAMKRGDWRQCKDYILSIKAWDLFIEVEPVKALLTRWGGGSGDIGGGVRLPWYGPHTHRKIQEETLRTYIFAYGEIYDTLR